MAQLNVKVPDDLKKAAEVESEERGYMDLSEFVRDAIREKVGRSALHEVRDDDA